MSHNVEKDNDQISVAGKLRSSQPKTRGMSWRRSGRDTTSGFGEKPVPRPIHAYQYDKRMTHTI
jgi:hypothetical protein